MYDFNVDFDVDVDVDAMILGFGLSFLMGKGRRSSCYLPKK
jgi:hypothetical protein